MTLDIFMDAISTITTLMGVIIDTSVKFATVVITNYWPYLLVFGVIASITRRVVDESRYFAKRLHGRK